ncbi:RAxF-45 family protein [Aquibacillus koreensis]
MLHVDKYANDTHNLYFYRAICHDFFANGIRMPFFSN